MRLVANWRAVLRHAWSVRFILLAMVLEVLAALLTTALAPRGNWCSRVITLACCTLEFRARDLRRPFGVGPRSLEAPAGL